MSPSCERHASARSRWPRGPAGPWFSLLSCSPGPGGTPRRNNYRSKRKEGQAGAASSRRLAMALPAKKVSVSAVVAILLLFFSAASFPVHARSRSYGKIQSTWDDDREYETFKGYLNLQRPRGGRKYQTYQVLLRKHPNGDAMDDKDARRRWYESFLPSTLTDSGEPRLVHCYTFDVNGFLASLTPDQGRGLGVGQQARSSGNVFG
ncbi:uncharacterized protein [Miscanthus floridulus]|uniref:uncharacterized protein n=1 Tax=Miscanthus floridulus TaxID=154761 RepID=UPI00345A598B